MKKFFTFVICALCAVSVWGTEYTIGSGDGVSYNTPLTTGTSYYKCFTQQLYLASELTAAGASAGTITALQFQSKTYESSTGYSSTVRTNFKVYITTTNNNTLTSFVAEKGTEVFSSTSLSIPKGEKFVGTLSTAFPWNGTDNIIVTVVDNSNVKIGGVMGNIYKGFKAFSAPNRGVYFADESYEGTINLSSQTNPLSEIPIIIFDIEGSTPSPSITPSTETLDFGSFYPAGETVSQTFTVSASNLTENISLSTTAAGVTINPSTINKGEDGSVTDAEVTVTLGAEYEFKAGTKITLSSGTDVSQDVSLSATQITDDNFVVPTAINFVNNVGTYYNISNATIKTIDENSMSFNNATSFTADYSAIAGQQAYSASGKFTNLKGKLVAADRFVIFSFGTYTGPSKPTITLDENIDNTTAIEALADGTDISSITIKRTFAVNEWNTIILPVEIESGDIINMFGDDAQVMAFDNAEVSSSRITLNFKSANSMSAGTPYLVKPSKEVDNPKTLQNREFYQSTFPVTNDGLEFVGVLVPTAMDAEGDDYIIVGSGNTLLHPSGAGTIKGMRAYFHVIGTEAKAAIKKSPMISLSTGSTTAMTLVKPDAGKAYKAIENGRIVIKANGKKVNVLGQTVK